VYHNQEIILSEFKVTKVKKKLEVQLSDGANIFVIEAMNEGAAPPNTAMIIMEGDNSVEFKTNLRKGQKTTVTYLKPQ
jgi:hypothetical protein